jgi:hypothetical protein
MKTREIGFYFALLNENKRNGKKKEKERYRNYLRE